MIAKGVIWAEWKARCGLCRMILVLSGGPAQSARDNGWKNTKDRGWVCGQCLATLGGKQP